MKLYAHPSRPAQQGFYTPDAPPASAYRLEQQLQAAYAEQLYSWWEPDQLYDACFPGFRQKPTRQGLPPSQATINKRVQGLEERLGYELPDILARMSPAELQAAAEVLLRETLVGFIGHVLAQERSIVWRLKEGNCSTRLPDAGHAKAAGLGKAPVSRPAAVVVPARQPVPLPTPERRIAVPALRVRRAQDKRRYDPHNSAQLWLWPASEILGVREREAVL